MKFKFAAGIAALGLTTARPVPRLPPLKMHFGTAKQEYNMKPVSPEDRRKLRNILIACTVLMLLVGFAAGIGPVPAVAMLLAWAWYALQPRLAAQAEATQKAKADVEERPDQGVLAAIRGEDRS